MAAPIATRLGDILVRAQRLRPHQLGVALEVQRRAHLPLGRVLVGINLISPMQLRAALLKQKLVRVTHHLASRKKQPVLHEVASVTPVAHFHTHSVHELRAELAGLKRGSIARIIENA